MFNKKISMTVTDYFRIVKPTYTYFKITPSKNIKNHNSTLVASLINKCYKHWTERIHKLEKGFFYEKEGYKVSYFVLIEKFNVEFYMLVPEYYKNLFKEKMSDVWKEATIEEVIEVPTFDDTAVKYQLGYTKDDAMSLSTDRRTKPLLDSNLNVIDILEEEERIGIYYNFIPTNQYEQTGFKTNYIKTMQKRSEGKSILKDNINGLNLLYLVFEVGLGTVFDVIQSFLGGNSKKQAFEKAYNFFASETLKQATKDKRNKEVTKTQIMVVSQSKDSKRATQNAQSVCESFNTLEGDNELTYKKYKGKFDIESMKTNTATSLMSADEIQNFIDLPSRDLIEKYNLNAIATKQQGVPYECLNGNIRLGTNEVKGLETKAYFSSHKENSNMSTVIFAQMGSGKTTFLANVGNDCVKANEGLLVLDYIGNCKLAREIKKVTPKEKLIEIDLSDKCCSEAFGFNEAKFMDSTDLYERLQIANTMASQTLELINSINSADMELKPRMRRFLSSACLVVYAHEGNSLKHVIQCLEDHTKRMKYINNLPKELKDYLEEEVNCLMELNEYDKNTKEVTGTKDSKIEHILDRINLLKEHFMLKMMFNRSTEDNINFVSAMQEGKIILVYMPESFFNTEHVKSILATYFISKVWLASQIREGQSTTDLKRFNVICDELHQCPVSQRMLNYILPQARKFRLRFFLTAHGFDQVKNIEKTLTDVGANFMLLQGCGEENFKKLENLCYPYEIHDFLGMKQYQSLNVIRTTEGYKPFITKLPDELKPTKHSINNLPILYK